MKLNDLKPGAGARQPRKRLGRGIGSGLGKTAGRGHKGQRARAGGYHKVGFEGGQMPIQRRLPKRGFHSALKALTAEVRLSDLEKMKETDIDLSALKAAGVVPAQAQTAKVIKTGELKRKVVLNGILASKGAREAVAAAGGSIAEVVAAAKPRKLQAKPKTEDKPAEGGKSRKSRRPRRPRAE